MAETVAIVRYLAREKNVADNWYPKNSKDQARVDEYLEWQHLNTRHHCTVYFWLVYVVQGMQGKTVSDARLAEAKKDMIKTLDFISNVWLADGNKFLTGNTISIADIMAATEIEQTSKWVFLT